MTLPFRTVFLDLIFPRVCTGCGLPMPEGEHGHICWDCRTHFSFVQPPYCQCCGDPVAGHISAEYTCAWCTRNKPAFTWARSALRYRDTVKTCLLHLKYHDGWWLQSDFQDIFRALRQTCPTDVEEADWVTCVPLHFLRERRRGYNQAALLGAWWAKELSIPLHPHSLFRARNTPTQTRLSANQRAQNIKGAFGVHAPRKIANSSVLLVDDVMTTGATVSECARMLKAAGAARVFVLTIARG